MPLNYTTYVDQIANLLVISSTEANFQTMLPGMIDYAEQRLYRELDLLFTQSTLTTTLSSGSRNMQLPAAPPSVWSMGYIVVDNINILTPVGATTTNGARNQLVPVTRDFIDIAWPGGSTVTGVPQFWAMAFDTAVILGPAPDAAYLAEVTGTMRPLALSVTNSSTILTQYVPDIFITASMIYGSGYQRDFSAQGDNPQMGAAWEAQYQKQIQSAQIEQARAKYQSEAWTSDQPSPIATPKRV